MDGYASISRRHHRNIRAAQKPCQLSSIGRRLVAVAVV
jgi:hypothetical protein